MCKRLFLTLLISLLIGVSSSADPVGIFEDAVDVGDIMPLVNVLSDITTPSDFVRGVPDDGDWPGGGHPALAIDNNVNTKYMHF